MPQEDFQLGGAIVRVSERERAGGGDHEEPRLKSATRFGVFRARWKWALACHLRDSSMRELADHNPMKTTMTSIAEAVADRTRALPGRGFLPVNPDAPLLNLKEALWLVVVALVTFYVCARLLGFHPIRWETGHPLSFWIDGLSDTA